MMKKPYDDDRYLEWHHEFNKLVSEFLDTEGNSSASLLEEFNTAVENAEAEE